MAMPEPMSAYSIAVAAVVSDKNLAMMRFKATSWCSLRVLPILFLEYELKSLKSA
jgi:hypothetical protein